MSNSISAILINVLPFIVILAIFYFLMIVPEKKRKKKYDSMISELKVNDEIVTRGGILGKIVHIDEKYVTIESSSAKTRIKMDKGGIAYKVGNDK
ncbi:preprotein translocase subunit YajC [Clostridium sp. SM-530-WT-3G]|uniref:preprotein translocase subunit YajC n=1 Tax=Clostridium sp. SM-530-WT-3G TaxID=2725303 RepID=UPI00145F396B|nr:preprotein translocase subunit YajC [Clostridium sp. SM-530-WT-3G]NME82491.1 preprotein translocase subunit YajC [Clostridium sp. SM-530-WT-3G]